MDRPFAELDDLYRDVVLDHYRSPRGREDLPRVDVEQEGFNPICGDEVHVALEIESSSGNVQAAQIRCRGCAISVASGSMLSELLRNRSREEIERLTAVFRELIHGAAPPEDLDVGDLEALRGVAKFPVRVKCALLPWMTVKEAIASWGAGRAKPEGKTTTEEKETDTGSGGAQ